MRPPHASCRKFPPTHVQCEDYFQGRFSTRTVLCFSRSKLGILMIPRLPDVKPPCLTRRALGPGVFFGPPDSLGSKRSCPSYWLGRSAAGRSCPTACPSN